MRELAGVLAVACLVNCSEPAEDAEKPDWSVSLQHFAIDGWVLANSTAIRRSDGSFVVAVHVGPDTPVRIGDQMLEGSQLARVSADGAVLGIAAADEADLSGGGARTELRTDDAGNTIVLWGGASLLASYDANLNRIWVQPFERDWSPPFDVSPLGAISLISRDGLAGTATIRSLHPDGTPAWEATQLQILATRYAANGDLFVVGGGHRWRYDSTGNVVDDIRVTSGTTFADPQGGWFYAKPMAEASELDRYDSTGQLAWSQTYPGKVYLADMIFSATGNILMHASVELDSPVLLEGRV
ncbi:MAG: hypothetical protein M3619_11205 [Myxococcota bacterium]|nr:hypothetical protein [Myxococcota bacterium]